MKRLFWVLVCALAGLAADTNSVTDWEISGTVQYDARPLKNATVYVTGPERVKVGTTDAQGRFVLHGKTPGRFLIHAQKEDLPEATTRTVSVVAGSHIDHVDFDIPKGGVIAGRVFDDQKQPVQGLYVEAMAQLLKRNGVVLTTKNEAVTDDRGEYRIGHLADGIYVITVRPRSPEAKKRDRSPEKAMTLAYPSVTFYPNGQLLSDATPIEVRSGQERLGVDLALKKMPSHCVDFKVDPESASLEKGTELGVDIYPSLGTLGVLSWTFPRRSLSAGVDYAVCALTPGQYKVEASVEKVEQNRLHVAGYRAETVTIDKQDVDLGTIQLLPALDVRGMASVKNETTQATLPSGLRVALWLNGVNLVRARRVEADLQPSGAFVISGVLPNEYELRLVGQPLGWYLVSASQQGRNVEEGGLRPGNGDVELVLGSDGATVRGRALAENGDGSTNATVFLLPKAGGPAIATRTDQSGAFVFDAGIAPGEYQLAAVTGLYEAERSDPDVGKHFRISGKDLTLGPRQPVNLDLKVEAVR